MSVNASYSLHVDTNGDGDFSDVGDDLSAYWMSMSISHGMTAPMDNVARSASLTVTLKNDGQLFSPQHANALTGFRQGRAIRVQMTYSATTITKFLGIIDHIRPAIGANGRRVCEVSCDGYLMRLQQEPCQTPVMQNTYSGNVISRILRTVTAPIPSTPGWLAGISGRTEAGDTTVAAAEALAVDTGNQFFALVGDNWKDNQTAYGALAEVTKTEGGLLYETPAGGLIFKGRDFFTTDRSTAVDGIYDGTYIGPESSYAYGEELYSGVELTYNPRQLARDVSVLAKAEGELRIDHWIYPHRDNLTKITLEFKDANGNKVGGMNVIKPVPGVDFRAVHKSGKADVTKHITTKMVRYGDRVDLTFDIPTGPSTRAFITGLQVRGRKYVDKGQQTIRVINQASAELYQLPRVLKVSMPIIQDEASADTLAHYLLDQNSLPRGLMSRISFYANRDNAHMLEALNRTIGDRIALSEAQTGADGDYWIVGIQHRIAHTNAHKVTFVLRPTPAYAYWLAGVAGYSEAGDTTIAGG